jgi:hypothetical protein
LTLPNPPQSGYSVEPTPVPPGTVASPLAPLIVEKRRGSPALTLLLGFALVVAVGGVAFAAGRLTAPASAAATGTGTRGGFGGGNGFAPGASGAPGGGFAGGGGLGGGALVTVQGTVQAITPTSISLTLPSGAVVQIPLESATTYHGRTDATAADVKPGSQVQVELTGGAGGFGGRGGQGGGQGAPNASAPAPVGSPGTAPAASPGTTGATGATGGGTGGRGALGPARDVTIVTP